jgi:tRNA nucleotidyltransferase (CCA-adding enzyme)
VEPDLKPASLYVILRPLGIEHLIYMMAKARNDAMKEQIAYFITSLKDASPILKGDDLKAMGSLWQGLMPRCGPEMTRCNL